VKHDVTPIIYMGHCQLRAFKLGRLTPEKAMGDFSMTTILPLGAIWASFIAMTVVWKKIFIGAQEKNRADPPPEEFYQCDNSLVKSEEHW